MSSNPGLQLSVNVKGRSCLVIGGDEEATDKVTRLLEAGARVTVIHPTLNETLRKLTASAKILHRGRHFRATDVEGITLVLNTIRDDAALSASLFELARKERFLVWSADQPEVSTASMPALISRGDLRIAISTAGAAPALASRLRQHLETLFDDTFVRFLEWVASQREDAKASEADPARRRTLLREAVEGLHFTGRLDYPQAFTRSQDTTEAGKQTMG